MTTAAIRCSDNRAVETGPKRAITGGSANHSANKLAESRNTSRGEAAHAQDASASTTKGASNNGVRTATDRAP